jgi:hypothetical protein
MDKLTLKNGEILEDPEKSDKITQDPLKKTIALVNSLLLPYCPHSYVTIAPSRLNQDSTFPNF